MKRNNWFLRFCSTCLHSTAVAQIAFLLLSCPLQGQIADTTFFVNEARQWWDSSFYRYSTFIGEMPVEPIWEGAEVAEVPGGTHLIVLPIVNGTSVQVSDGWHGTAVQPNGGVRLVLKRFSSEQIYPLLFFVFGYSDYVAAIGPGAVYSKNKPQRLDTTFTGEAYYMRPGMFPNDTLRLLNGAVIQNGGIAKEFYPEASAAGEASYRCCVEYGTYETTTIIISGDEYFLPEVVITTDCSGCATYWVYLTGGYSDTGNNTNWSPGGLPGGGGSGGVGSQNNEPGGIKVNPKVDAKLCPDGSLRPSSGICKCPDGTPMPSDGDCGEGPCTLTHFSVSKDGATVQFEGPWPTYYDFEHKTTVAGKLTDCNDGNSTFATLLNADVIPFTSEIIEQHHLITGGSQFKIPKIWTREVYQYVKIKVSRTYTVMGFDYYWEQARAGSKTDLKFSFKYK